MSSRSTSGRKCDAPSASPHQQSHSEAERLKSCDQAHNLLGSASTVRLRSTASLCSSVVHNTSESHQLWTHEIRHNFASHQSRHSSWAKRFQRLQTFSQPGRNTMRQWYACGPLRPQIKTEQQAGPGRNWSRLLGGRQEQPGWKLGNLRHL